MFLGSIAGICKGADITLSEESKVTAKVEMIGTVIYVASFILMIASLAGVIVFAIKLFIFYLYGTV